MAGIPDYYALLGISSDADARGIKEAFRRESFRWHPDKNPERPAEAHARFVSLTEAVSVLTDPRSRRQYDARRRARAAETGHAPKTDPPPDDSFAAAVDAATAAASRWEEFAASGRDAGRRGAAMAEREYRRRVTETMWELARRDQASVRISRMVTATRLLALFVAAGSVVFGVLDPGRWLVWVVALASLLVALILGSLSEAFWESRAQAHRGFAERIVARRGGLPDHDLEH